MANRAYLFSTEINDYNEIKDVEEPYYDSRWNIPLLWFLFFTEESIKVKNCYLDEDVEKVEESWEQVVLVEKKAVAIERFLLNLKCLTEIWKEIESDKEVVDFIERIDHWKGINLVLEPYEIVEDHPKAVQDFKVALKFLSDGKLNEFLETISDYAGKPKSQSLIEKFFSKFTKEEVKDSLNYFIGYTYW